MTPSFQDSISDRLDLGKIKGRKVIANFEGGRITSDAGIVLIAELDKKLEITAKFAEVNNLHKINDDNLENIQQI